MANKNMDEMRSLIRARLGEMRISAREASRRAGFNVGYIGDFLEGRSRAPESDRLERIAAALEMPIGQLVGIEGAGQARASDRKFTNNQQTAKSLIPLFAGKIDMAHPFTVVPDSPVGFVPILPLLESVPDAYAVTVFNNFNAPRYFVGEMVYVSPAAPVRVNDFTYGKWKNGEAAIGRLKEIGENGGVWEWLNPTDGHERFHEVDFADIEFYHRIMGSVG